MTGEIDPELPWGVWLRIEGSTFVDDSSGERWPNLRTAFWCGRLGMPLRADQPPPEILETIHAALAAIARRQPNHAEVTVDIFDASDRFKWMFYQWLAGQGLLEVESTAHPKAMTDEGWAVLRLLDATRPHSVRQHRPSRASVEMLMELGLGPEAREKRLARVEAEARKWDVAFLRSREAGRPTIIMTDRGDGPVPTLQTSWSMGFSNVEQRDRFYEWLCLRIDRWAEWRDMPHYYGASSLTHKLLEVMASSLADDDQHAA